MWKYNVDATFMHNKVGAEMCIRDHKGKFVKAKTVSFPPPLQVKEEEAFGLPQTINWIGELSLTNVIFNLDAKVVVDGFNNFCLDLSSFGFITRDCYLHFLNLCSSLLIGSYSRQANVIFYALTTTIILKYLISCRIVLLLF
jgi:hypothetical protein